MQYVPVNGTDSDPQFISQLIHLLLYAGGIVSHKNVNSSGVRKELHALWYWMLANRLMIKKKNHHICV